MDGIVPVVTAPRSQNVEQSLAELQARLAADREWHGGHYYHKGGAKTVLTELRVEMLKRNGIEAALAGSFRDRDAREAEIRRQAVEWAQRWDANSLVILRRGTIGYDTVKDFAKIKAKVLYVLCRTDRLFPPSIAPGVMHALTTAGVDARYFEIDSDLGHSASGPEHAKWAPPLREFLRSLMARLN
jgi:homoserine O-acetyltransferase